MGEHGVAPKASPCPGVNPSVAPEAGPAHGRDWRCAKALCITRVAGASVPTLNAASALVRRRPS
eukprot:15217062-Alexandrium_andersonii.AAC.1